MNQQVFLLNQDITQYCLQIQRVAPTLGDYGSVVTNDLPQFTGQNTEGFWDRLNPTSPFFAVTDLTTMPILIKDKGVTVFSGSIQEIETDSDALTANVTLRSDLQKTLERSFDYVSAASTDPATAAREILTQFNIPFDSGSFGAATRAYTADAVAINVNFGLPTIKIIECLQRLAQVGYARVYAVNGIVYWDYWRTDNTIAPLYTFTDNPTPGEPMVLWSKPAPSIVQKPTNRGYTVVWVGGTSTSGDADDTAPQINGGNDEPIKILTAQAALIIGDKWLSYIQRPQTRIKFTAPIGYLRELRLGYPVAVGWSRGHWTTQTIDITSLEYSNSLFGVIEGLTR